MVNGERVERITRAWPLWLERLHWFSRPVALSSLRITRFRPRPSDKCGSLRRESIAIAFARARTLMRTWRIKSRRALEKKRHATLERRLEKCEKKKLASGCMARWRIYGPEDICTRLSFVEVQWDVFCIALIPVGKAHSVNFILHVNNFFPEYRRRWQTWQRRNFMSCRYLQGYQIFHAHSMKFWWVIMNRWYFGEIVNGDLKIGFMVFSELSVLASSHARADSR